ncbi:hypothetical protein Vadar_032295 [Vaccinium darrowii]|uniref:Uncharacterized protein n=1 Tax=Vaccinium darrowii TaxID=229202 RepID=A0ACB7XLG0_9ERIC|nr:hypothetical protein Vadar_032295 [Vaccinium darrowii]
MSPTPAGVEKIERPTLDLDNQYISLSVLHFHSSNSSIKKITMDGCGYAFGAQRLSVWQSWSCCDRFLS